VSSPDRAVAGNWLQALLQRLTADTVPAPATDPLDERFGLLQFSYQEVLDATKHQDDKINRLLTTVAFITAAALALTTLGHDSAPITATFLVDGRLALPLTSIGLAGFLAGVTVSVILLIVSMTTPLVLPGGSNPVTPAIEYVPGPKTGQFYFNEIVGSALPGWHRKWRQDISALKRERNDSLVRETHNLAVRTEYKYQRSNAAVAVLSFALLSFVLSAILILVAAERQDPKVNAPLTTNLTVRLVLAAAFFGYCVLQLLAGQRKPPTVLDNAYPAYKLRVSVPTWGRWYVLVASSVAPQLLLLPSEPPVLRWVLAIGLPALAWLLLGLALPWYSRTAETEQRAVAVQLQQGDQVLLPDPTTQREIRRNNARIRRSWLAAGGFALVHAGYGVLVAQWSAHRELLALCGAYAAGLLLVVSTIWQIGRNTARRADNFRQAVEDQAGSVQQR
jgi:hypothetical protein